MTRRRSVLTGCLVATTWACGLNFEPRPDPTRFFLMSAESTDVAPEGGPVSGGVLGVGPIRYAPYLDQQKLVTRVDTHQVEFADFERWAEPFHEHFQRVLAQNLRSLTGAESVELFPWTRAVDVRVEVDLRRFDRLPDGAAAIAAEWRIRDAGTDRPLHEDETVITEAAVTSGRGNALRTEDSVLAMSHAVGRLAREIAERLASIRLER